MDPSAHGMAKRLRREFAGAKFLVMGQTVFWDEPVKAVLRRVLDVLSPEAEILVGIHDTDYFSRLRNPKGTGAFVLTGHDDGATRDMWVAAAAASELFGTETVVSRRLLVEHGIPIEKLAREGGDSFLSECTKAWGWRGVAMDVDPAPIVASVPAKAVAPRLVDLLEWATSETRRSLCGSEDARRVAGELVGEIVSAVSQLPPDATLSDLYLRLAESYWHRMLPGASERLRFCRSSELFRFNTETARLPRFRFLNLFLDPKTRDAARRAYNEAVRESEIYDLDRFSEVALPFDLVLLRKDGSSCRGTICVADNEVAVLSSCSTVLHTKKPPTDVEELAALIEKHLGPNAVVVGKAVALVPMILSEWVFVLHRFGSAYVPQTQEMVAGMRAAGLEVVLHPILRIEHDAWSALRRVDASFCLPSHLTQAFGSARVSATRFADDWKEAADGQKRLLDELKLVSNPEDLTEYLSHREHGPWLKKLEKYVESHSTLLRLSREIERVRHQGMDAWARAKKAKAEVQRLEKDKGHVVRQHIRPVRIKLRDLSPGPEAERLRRQITRFEKQRDEIVLRIGALRERIKADEVLSRDSDDAHHTMERSPEFAAARRDVAAVEREAQLLRLRPIRNALLTVHGLPYAGARPAWWWFPMVDASGGWFEELLRTAKFRFEEV